MSESRTFKGLLLEMKLASSSEERIIAEEELAAMHDSLRKLLEVYESALERIAVTEISYTAPDFKWLQDWRYETKEAARLALQKRAEIMGVG